MKIKIIMVTTFLNDHGDLAESYGFLIQTGDKTILISGDTGPSANLLEFGNEVDILVHEVYSQAGFEKKRARLENLPQSTSYKPK